MDERHSEKAQEILKLAEERRKEREILDVEGEKEQILIFLLGDEFYGLKGEQIEAIVSVRHITYVPGAPEFILGVVNVRGEIESVLDIKQVLGLGRTELTRQSRLLIAQVEGTRSGLLVDDVRDIAELPQSAINPPLGTLPEPQNEFILGEVLYEGREVAILNLATIFQKVLES